MGRKLCRELSLSGLVFLGLGAFWILLAWLEAFHLRTVEMLLISGLFLASHSLSAVFLFWPAGPDLAQARLGLAAFCRTFAPLLALVCIDHYLMSVLTRTNAGPIIASYISSLALTIIAAFRVRD